MSLLEPLTELHASMSLLVPLTAVLASMSLLVPLIVVLAIIVCHCTVSTSHWSNCWYVTVEC